MPRGLTTAPANPAPRWHPGYVEALREVGAQEKAIPFCIQWARGFFAEHPGRRRRNLGRPEIQAFLRKVAARPNVTDGQVHPPSPTSYGAAGQARGSLEVDNEPFRGIALALRPDGAATATADKRTPAVRETNPSRPRAEQSTTIQHRSPSNPIFDANPMLPGVRKSNRSWRLPADRPPRLARSNPGTGI
jgi:hypothetical protein